jgi:hypothetical protein
MKTDEPRQAGLSGIFRLRRGPFGRRPHYPIDPVNPVQLFSLKKESIPLFF